jgi:hypothetical protein
MRMDIAACSTGSNMDSYSFTMPIYNFMISQALLLLLQRLSCEASHTIIIVVSASSPAFQRLLLPRISRGQVPARLLLPCSLLLPRIKLPNTTDDATIIMLLIISYTDWRETIPCSLLHYS